MRRIIYMFSITAMLAVLLVQSAYAEAGDGVWETRYTSVDGVSRKYIIYQPAVCENKQCPLLIMFHGLGGTADGAASANYNWQATADQNGFVAAFPESLNIAPKSFFGYQYDPPLGGSTKHWDIAPVTDPFGETQDTHFTEVLIAEMVEDYDISPSHVYAVGHSYGAFFAYDVAMVLRDKIAGFAAANGGLVQYFGISWPVYPPDAGDNPVPGYIVYSANDPVVSPQYSVDLYDALTAKGHTAVLDEIVPGIQHGWDSARNQLIWNFLISNSPALPPGDEPEPEKPVVVEFGKVESVLSESTGDNSEIFSVKLDNESAETVAVKISVDESSTAIEGSDFEIADNILTFAPGDTAKSVQLDVFPDAELENDETVILNLSIVSGNAVIGAISHVVVTVKDSTGVFEFASVYGSGSESAGNIDIPVEMTQGNYSGPVTLEVSVDPASTASEGLDFTIDNTSIVYAGSGESLPDSIHITILDDGEWDEGDETVILNLSVVSGPAVVGGNAQYTYTIVDDDNAPVLYFWKPWLFKIIRYKSGIIFTRKAGEWALLFDYGNHSTVYDGYGQSDRIKPLDIEVSWKYPYYWWTLWHGDNGRSGLWAHPSNQNSALDKYVYFSGSGDLRDLALNKYGEPFVLWQKPDGSAKIVRYRTSGKVRKVFVLKSPGVGWSAKKVQVDVWNTGRVLWRKGDRVRIQYFRSWNGRSWFSPIHILPAGYDVSDFDLGRTRKDFASRLLLVGKNGDAKIWRINRWKKGNLLSSVSLDAPDGFAVHSMETAADNYLRVMFSGDDGTAQIWKVNAKNGKVLWKKSYTME